MAFKKRNKHINIIKSLICLFLFFFDSLFYLQYLQTVLLNTLYIFRLDILNQNDTIILLLQTNLYYIQITARLMIQVNS